MSSNLRVTGRVAHKSRLKSCALAIGRGNKAHALSDGSIDAWRWAAGERWVVLG